MTQNMRGENSRLSVELNVKRGEQTQKAKGSKAIQRGRKSFRRNERSAATLASSVRAGSSRRSLVASGASLAPYWKLQTYSRLPLLSAHVLTYVRSDLLHTLDCISGPAINLH
eukprot:575865-Pleurochrysis_carterae.AAC.1